MTKPKIQLIGVKKRFGSKVVLDGVDLTVEPRSSLVIIGGSGTGKSVTIKSILGIIRPDEGTILVDGGDITHINGAARDVQEAINASRASFGFGEALIKAMIGSMLASATARPSRM